MHLQEQFYQVLTEGWNHVQAARFGLSLRHRLQAGEIEPAQLFADTVRKLPSRLARTIQPSRVDDAVEEAFEVLTGHPVEDATIYDDLVLIRVRVLASKLLEKLN